ncbi:hypothetical protein CEUSTIGMA_g8090.t1 [Chlamydomonas eustigma]|uniref:Uncharacterized protein n=1 Tax=Chlamydomonas eustigma TaxID=1157962 RepID=A0A250XC35_9CHLO|nr:hypothetical protein CEUSTIGMA_g8090.t1 [Chlamydomonas eustigma]|eukprot:GAX80655.1 hypothetical protein CEUSTIGMA_g8090.t1 [Chlamydomonas eustigma]
MLSQTNLKCSSSCSTKKCSTSTLYLRGRRSKIFPPQQAFVASISDSADAVKAASQILSTCAIAFGAWSLLREGAVEQEEGDQRFSSQPCPRCNGARYEPCACTRWSDQDSSGCATCSKTGYMPCRSCRGGGTAVPILSTVRREVPRQPGSGS